MTTNIPAGSKLTGCQHAIARNLTWVNMNGETANIVLLQNIVHTFPVGTVFDLGGGMRMQILNQQNLDEEIQPVTDAIWKISLPVGTLYFKTSDPDETKSVKHIAMDVHCPSSLRVDIAAGATVKMFTDGHEDLGVVCTLSKLTRASVYTRNVQNIVQ